MIPSFYTSIDGFKFILFKSQYSLYIITQK